MTPESRLLVARFRVAIARSPELLRREAWYLREGRRIRALAREYGIPEERAIGAAAVLSPAIRWESLMDRLPAFLAAYAALGPDGEPPRFPGYRGNVRRAWRVLAGLGEPRGPKVSRFARNLAGDESPVTVDRWAARAAGLPESGGVAWYRRIEEAYRAAARECALAPSAFQAILWIAIRENLLARAPVVG